MKRIILLFVLSFILTVGLTGCGNNPDDLHKKGKYAEAYTEYVKHGGASEVALKTEKMNASPYEIKLRHDSGNQANHDYSYAAECQKMLGNTAETSLYYNKIIEISNYRIKTPRDQGLLLRDSFASLMNAVQRYKSSEEEYAAGKAGTSTDPYAAYKNLCDTGADEAEVKKALAAYNEAKANFDALKNQK